MTAPPPPPRRGARRAVAALLLVCAGRLRAAAGQAVGNLTVLPAASATVQLPLKVAGSLCLELQAADYAPATRLWDNRATPGAVSTSNGDFGVMTFGALTDVPPTLSAYQGLPAVVFAPTLRASLTTLAAPTGPAPAGLFDALYEGRPFTLETVIMPLNRPDGSSGEEGQESPYMQWGARSAPACQSGFAVRVAWRGGARARGWSPRGSGRSGPANQTAALCIPTAPAKSKCTFTLSRVLLRLKSPPGYPTPTKPPPPPPPSLPPNTHPLCRASGTIQCGGQPARGTATWPTATRRRRASS